MAWLYLLAASVFEMAWPVGMKSCHGFTRLWPTVFAVLAGVCSFVLLVQAMRTLEMGTCYAVWTGLGTAGAVVLGIVLFRESTDPLRILCIAMILAGVVGLKITTKEPPAEPPETTSGACADEVAAADETPRVSSDIDEG